MPEVNCAYDVMLNVDDLTGHPRNPNTHSEEQVRLLAKVIEAQGWRAPITVSTASGYIVRGHARLLAAEELGLEEVPVDYQDYGSEAEETADLVADNRLAELADTDRLVLKDILLEYDTGATDMELFGFTFDDLEELMTAAPPPEPEPEVCPRCGYNLSDA